MLIGILSALLAGAMLGLYALPGKYVKDFQQTSSGSVFFRTRHVLYTGRYTSDDLRRESGAQFGQFRGFCLETSKYPNGPNINGPRSVLSPGDKYSEKTVYKFSVDPGLA